MKTKNRMMNKITLLSSLLFFLTSTFLYAQPANDNACNAISITVGALGTSPNCGGLFPYDNIGATPQAGEFAGSCWGNPGSAPTVWFSFVAPAGGFVAVSTNYPGGSNDDTQLTLWEGTPCPGDDLAALTEIGCSEDIDASNFLSAIPATAVTSGDTYYVQLNGWNGTQGDFCLEVFEVEPCNTDLTCDALENICICSDCASSCDSTNIVFADYNPIAISNDPVVYCESAISTTANPIPAAIYIPMAEIGNDTDCVTWDLSSTQGTFYNSAATIAPITSVDNGTIFFLRMTDADLTASAGITTITFTASGTATPCTKTIDIDWNGTILQDDGSAWAGSANAQCGCVSPTATVQYDCVSSSIVVNVTDAGSGGFDITVPGTGLPTQTITATVPMDYSFGPLPQDSTYTINISDGNPACNLLATGIYPNCRTAMAGCNDILLDGGLDSIPSQNWVEVADTNGVAVIPAGNINAWGTRLLGNGSAWIGGWGSVGPSTSSISQTVTIPAGTATLYFWGNLTVCDSPSDVMTFSINGDPMLWSINGGDASCGSGTWFEYMVDVSAYADGGTHTITFEMTEAGTNGGVTNFFMDEIFLESCPSGGCPATLTLTNAEFGSQIYEASNWISSTDVILASEDVEYHAGNYIDMLADFEVELNADFHAFILDCSVGPKPENDTTTKSKSSGKLLKRNTKDVSKLSKLDMKSDSRKKQHLLRTFDALKY